MTTTITIDRDAFGLFVAIAVDGKEVIPPARPNEDNPADLFHDVIHAVLGVARASGLSPVLAGLATETQATHELRNLEEDAVLAIGRYLTYGAEHG